MGKIAKTPESAQPVTEHSLERRMSGIRRRSRY